MNGVTIIKSSSQSRIIKCSAGILVGLFLALLLLAQTAFAEEESNIINSVDPLESGDNYSAVIYDSSNGLPTSVANDIVNTKDGSIWIASYAGLIRYDGREFKRIETSEQVNSKIGRAHV